jgi:hypothetical protein
MTSVRINEDVLSLFQEVIRRKKRKLKGAQSEAVNEAVLLWLAHKGEMNAVSFTVELDEYVLSLPDFIERLQTTLKGKSVRCTARLLGPAATEPFVVKVLEVVIGRYGKPKVLRVVEEDGEKSWDLSELGDDLRRLVRKFCEIEDGELGEVSLNVEWKCVRCHITPAGYVFLEATQRIKGFETFELVAETRSQSKKP